MPEHVPEKYAMNGVIPEWEGAGVPKDKVALQSLHRMTRMVQGLTGKINTRDFSRTGCYRTEGLAISTPYFEDPLSIGDLRNIMRDTPP